MCKAGKEGPSRGNIQNKSIFDFVETVYQWLRKDNALSIKGSGTQAIISRTKLNNKPKLPYNDEREDPFNDDDK